MATSFRKAYNVITRQPGYWFEGKYRPPIDDMGTVNGRQLTIQEASARDIGDLETTPYYFRAARFIKIYSDFRLNAVDKDNPGDLVLFDNKQFLIIAEGIYMNLGSSVSHYRYMAGEVIES